MSPYIDPPTILVEGMTIAAYRAQRHLRRRVLTIPRHMIGLAMDTLFGKPEPFDFTGSTIAEHTNTEAQR